MELGCILINCWLLINYLKTVFCKDGWKVVGDQQCAPCPVGTYKDNDEDVFGQCTPCPDGFTTLSDGSTNRYDCSIGNVGALINCSLCMHVSCCVWMYVHACVSACLFTYVYLCNHKYDFFIKWYLCYQLLVSQVIIETGLLTYVSHVHWILTSLKGFNHHVFLVLVLHWLNLQDPLKDHLVDASITNSYSLLLIVHGIIYKALFKANTSHISTHTCRGNRALLFDLEPMTFITTFHLDL